KRPWADLSPDLLNLIYAKLPPGYGGDVEFRSVCKNWRRIDPDGSVSASKPSHLEVPIPRCYHPLQIPDGAPERSTINGALVIHMWASGWCLLGRREDQIFGCYNPLFRWPTSFVRLPECTLNDTMVAAAISAPPTARDWTILLVEGAGSFRTLRRGQRRWREYTYSPDWNRFCHGIGYRDRMFFCLFHTGEVLMFAIDGGCCSRRRMLLPYREEGFVFHRVVVAATFWCGEKSIVLTWAQRGDEWLLQLAGVERRTGRVRYAWEIGDELLLQEGSVTAAKVVYAWEEIGMIVRKDSSLMALPKLLCFCSSLDKRTSESNGSNEINQMSKLYSLKEELKVNQLALKNDMEQNVSELKRSLDSLTDWLVEKFATIRPGDPCESGMKHNKDTGVEVINISTYSSCSLSRTTAPKMSDKAARKRKKGKVGVKPPCQSEKSHFDKEI
ncbi:unnamed protein product, partial [Linum tenue]